MRARALERLLLDLYAQNQLFGTVHTCIGQELCATALHPHLQAGHDAFFGTHRCHGHYVAHGAPIDGFLAELMGREGAVCQGRGGSQHLHWQRFFSSGIQGGTALLATGFAWAQKLRGEAAIAVAQLGDGTLGEGAVYEAFTFASLLQAPVLFLLEWNGYAQSTDVTRTTPGDLTQRIAGFGLRAVQADDRKPEELFTIMRDAVATVRGGEPLVLIVKTRRLMAHSKGDDDRPKELIEALWREDPLSLHIAEHGLTARYDEIAAALRAIADDVIARPKVALGNVDALPPGRRRVASRELHADLAEQPHQRVVSELNRALHELMTQRDELVLVGEDLADPYGGAFKVTRGLSTRFPTRVFSTPISEAAIAGVSNGLALAGLRPVAEIMFADFTLLAADQIINHAAKTHFMYGGQVTCPTVVRIASGGRRGYGPTHSQSPESLFCGVAGLRVVALSHRHLPGVLLRAVLDEDAPTLFVENKLLYTKEPASALPFNLRALPLDAAPGALPALAYVPAEGLPAQITMVTYGGMTEIVEAAMQQLFVEEELEHDYFVLTQLWPLDPQAIAQSVARTRRLLVVEEGPSAHGIGASVIAAVAETLGAAAFASRALGALPVPIPSARHLEDAVLPSSASVAAAVRALL